MGASEKYGGGHVCVGERGISNATNPVASANQPPTDRRPSRRMEFVEMVKSRIVFLDPLFIIVEGKEGGGREG